LFEGVYIFPVDHVLVSLWIFRCVQRRLAVFGYDSVFEEVESRTRR
jgi:hypothetical protein